MKRNHCNFFERRRGVCSEQCVGVILVEGWWRGLTAMVVQIAYRNT